LLEEDLLIHLFLDDHEAGVDEGPFEELALEHLYQVHHLHIPRLPIRVLKLIVLLTHDVGSFGAFSECVLGVLAVDALIVELLGTHLELMEHLEHVIIDDLLSLDQGQQERFVRHESLVQPQLLHNDLPVALPLLGLLLLDDPLLEHLVVMEQRPHQEILNDLQVTHRIVVLGLGRLSSSICACVDSPLFFFFGAFLEEDLPEDFFLFLVGVIILDVVVAGLVEHEVVVVVAVGVLVPHPLVLLPLRLHLAGALGPRVPSGPRPQVRSQQKDALVEPTDDWDLQRLLLSL